MKVKQLIVLLLALTLLTLLFAACETGNPAMKNAAGIYQGLYTKVVGNQEDAADAESPFVLTLKPDGTGTHARDKMEFQVTWSLEGETITVRESFIGITRDYTGSLKNGELHLFDGNPENPWTVEYVYQKQ